MIDPDFEIRRLRWKMQDRNFDPADIDYVCDQAMNDIHSAVLDVVSAATSEAVSYAETVGVDEFLSDVDVRQEGWHFTVVTRSGKTDYSVDRIENLPNLLKNAKTAADGSKYKVIPLKDKPQIGRSMFDSMQQAAAGQREARQALAQRATDRRSESQSIVDGVRNSVSKGLAARREAFSQGEVKFRTASSKQDPHSQWVIPEIGRDMTQYLFELNNKLTSTIESSVSDIMNLYLREYA